jgi:UPF0716 protein FxsA
MIRVGLPSMLLALIGLFLLVPLIEVALFILVGGQIGVGPTLFLCVADAVLGAVIVRHQGLQTLARFQSELQQGHLPAMDLAEGAALIAAGALLITPGFFTDAIGFLLLIPPARRAIIRWLARQFSGQIYTFGSGPRVEEPRPPNRDDGWRTTIDGEAEEIFDDNEPNHANPNSPWRH